MDDTRDWQAPEVIPLSEEDGASPAQARIRNLAPVSPPP